MDQKVHIILGNIWVYPGPSLSELGVCLHISGGGGMEWKALASKTYSCGQSGGINTEDARILDIWLGNIDGVFGEDWFFWVGM